MYQVQNVVKCNLNSIMKNYDQNQIFMDRVTTGLSTEYNAEKTYKSD